MACLAVGMSVAGIDANYPAGLRDDVLRSIAIDALFVQDEASAATIPADVHGRLKGLVVFQSASESPPAGAMSLASLTRNAAKPNDADTMTTVGPDDEALVVFSSGTTGRPKPIAYTHRQALDAVRAILGAFPDIGDGSHLLCWLPLANLFQRIVNLCGIERGATSYVISDPKDVMQFVPRANPHLLIGVPRFYEKLYAGFRGRMAASSRPLAGLANWALDTGVRNARAARAQGRRSPFDRVRVQIADWLVLRRIRNAFGSNLRYLVSGSAPMPLWLLEWFEGIGLPVFEAYGVSENIVPVAMNRPGMHRLATVGKPLPGQEMRLAFDSEILVRGPGVFHGYLSDSGTTAPGPDAQGFWATGDYGELDADGFLRITGRKSEVFKLSTGRWVAPAGLEGVLRRLPYVEHAIALGAGRPFVVALLSIGSGRIVRGAPGDVDPAHATAPPAGETDKLIRRDVRAATSALPPHERPAGVLVTTRQFTIEGGELTSNLKLRRVVVEREFATEIERLFAVLESGVYAPQGRGSDDASIPLVHWA